MPSSPPIAEIVVSSPNPTAPSPSRSVAYSTSTDHAAPNVMLNVKMVSTSVRTAAWRRTHRSPSAMSCRTWVSRTSSRPCGGTAIRATSSAPAPTSTAMPTIGSAAPIANSAAPIGGPASWLTVMNPACSRALAMREVVARDEHRQQGVRGVVGEHLGRPEHEERDQHEADGDCPGDDRRRDHAEHHRPDDVDDDHEQPTVEPIRERAGVEAEQELRQPLEERRQRHQPGVARLRRHQQRTGRDADAVAQVRAPRGAQQPAEPVRPRRAGATVSKKRRHERGV